LECAAFGDAVILYESKIKSHPAQSINRTDCIDANGTAVKVGDYYVREEEDSESHRPTFVSVECTGTEFLAKKIVHKCEQQTILSGIIL
jgi:hypothetical protein